ncbi:hypothetical protein ACQE32_06505 [Pantoea sp. FN0302]
MQDPPLVGLSYAASPASLIFFKLFEKQKQLSLLSVLVVSDHT